MWYQILGNFVPGMNLTCWIFVHPPGTWTWLGEWGNKEKTDRQNIHREKMEPADWGLCWWNHRTQGVQLIYYTGLSWEARVWLTAERAGGVTASRGTRRQGWWCRAGSWRQVWLISAWAVAIGEQSSGHKDPGGWARKLWWKFSALTFNSHIQPPLEAGFASSESQAMGSLTWLRLCQHRRYTQDSTWWRLPLPFPLFTNLFAESHMCERHFYTYYGLCRKILVPLCKAEE